MFVGFFKLNVIWN